MALAMVNCGNVHLKRGEFDLALEQYTNALALQESALPGDHPDIARTLHNMAQVHKLRGDPEQSYSCLERAKETVNKTLNAQHPLVQALLSCAPKSEFIEDEECIITRH